MFNFVKKLTGVSNTKPVVANSIEIAMSDTIQVSTPKEYISKLDRIYYNKTSPIGSNVSTVQFKQNAVIKRLTLELKDKSTGSGFVVSVKNVFNDTIDTITDENKLKTKSVINNNFYILELNYIVTETSILSIENIGSGKGTGILYIEYYE
jgi:hypothetical protein